ncbi:hypothetical protein LCGC14_1087860 [marine sediment metagenome]|uniref:Uncharacterized protein n=1 Tax=marine sediment metagenome TaxID=412755 RepID=A0A0F9N0Y2_9ZZZZ
MKWMNVTIKPLPSLPEKLGLRILVKDVCNQTNVVLWHISEGWVIKYWDADKDIYDLRRIGNIEYWAYLPRESNYVNLNIERSIDKFKFLDLE